MKHRSNVYRAAKWSRRLALAGVAVGLPAAASLLSRNLAVAGECVAIVGMLFALGSFVAATYMAWPRLLLPILALQLNFWGFCFSYNAFVSRPRESMPAPAVLPAIDLGIEQVQRQDGALRVEVVGAQWRQLRKVQWPKDRFTPDRYLCVLINIRNDDQRQQKGLRIECRMADRHGIICPPLSVEGPWVDIPQVGNFTMKGQHERRCGVPFVLDDPARGPLGLDIRVIRADDGAEIATASARLSHN